MLNRARLLTLAAAALALLAVAFVVLSDDSGVVAQPPDVFDRIDDLEDGLARVRSDIGGVRSDLGLARDDLSGLRGDIAVLSERMGRLTVVARPSTADPAAYTRSYVERAIARYQRDGRDAAIAYYNSPESIDDQWYLFMVDENDVFVAHGTNSSRAGTPAAEVLGPDGYPVGSVLAALATTEGAWMDYLHVNPSSGETQFKRSWLVRHDGMLFGSGWYEDGPSPLDQPGAYTQAYVQRAVQLYDALGRDALLSYYNSADSIDGQWYLFAGDSNDRLIVYGPNTTLRNARFSEVLDAHGYPSGRVIDALATADGAWLDYAFANPATGTAQLKHSWVMRHDGLIFGSGWYEDGPSRIHEPGAYTQGFVNRAVQLHRALGRQAAIDHYNSTDSVAGAWYVFIHDVDGTRVANPFTPERLGTNVNTLSTDITGRDYGAEMLAADERGAWVSYVFRNPAAARQYQQKHSWMVRSGDLLFGSGWYDRNYDLKSQSPSGYARALVEAAIERYQTDGREAALAYHRSAEALDGPWYVFILDSDGAALANPAAPEQVGVPRPPGSRVDATGRDYGPDFLAATEEGGWVDYVFRNPAANGQYQQKHTWIQRHDDLLFASGWYETDAAVQFDPAAFTRVVVQAAVQRYDAFGRDATVARYGEPDSASGDWTVFIIDADGTVLADAGGERGYDPAAAASAATTDGAWVELQPTDGASGVHRVLVVRRGDVVLGSSWLDPSG